MDDQVGGFRVFEPGGWGGVFSKWQGKGCGGSGQYNEEWQHVVRWTTCQGERVNRMFPRFGIGLGLDVLCPSLDSLIKEQTNDLLRSVLLPYCCIPGTIGIKRIKTYTCP
jgi:hypothetical protein